MGYLKIYPEWLPYARMKDRRGFISKRFGGGHSGVDSVGNQYGNPVCAVIDGRVTRVTTSGTLGNTVEYGNGTVRIAHYHLASTAVAVGQTVTAGETVLGVEGSTGSLAKGKHLHTSLWIGGVLTDPEPYLCGDRALESKEVRPMKYQVGDRVRVTGTIYTSAWGAKPTVSGGGKTYEITSVISMNGVTKPYLLGSAGFCSDTDIAAESGGNDAEVTQLRQQLTAATAKLDAIRKVLDG